MSARAPAASACRAPFSQLSRASCARHAAQPSYPTLHQYRASPTSSPASSRTCERFGSSNLSQLSGALVEKHLPLDLCQPRSSAQNGIGCGQRLASRGHGLRELARLSEHVGEVDRDGRTRRARGGQERASPREQSPGGAQVAAIHGAVSRSREVLGRSVRRGRPARDRRDRARPGSDAPARGGSRRSRPARRGRASTSQSAKRSCSSARVAFGSDSYAASRMRRWRKRKPSSSGNVGAVDRISSLRTSVARCASTSSRTGAGDELCDRAAVEHLALDGSALHDDTDVAVERVDARLEQRVDRRRHDDLAARRRARAPSRASPRRRAGCPRRQR